MKKLFFITVSVFAFQFSNAQEAAPIKKNQFLINAGTQFSNFDALEKNKNIYLGVEYKFKNDLSLGLKYTYSDLSFNHKNARTIGAPKLSSFQLQFNNDWSEKIGLNTDKFDVYTGVSFGLSTFTNNKAFLYQTNEIIDDNLSLTEFVAGGQIGFRYFITKRIGVQTELNFNTNKNYIDTNRISIGAGLTFKL